MEKKVCNIKGDGEELLRIFSELKVYLPRLSRKGRQAMFNLFENSADVIRCESQAAPKGTDITIFFKPTERLLDFLAAIRAGNFDNRIIKRNRHKVSPCLQT